MKTSETKNQRLGDLLHDVAWGWQKQNSYAFDRVISMYDCSLFDHQSEEDAFEPELNNGLASWDCLVTTDCGNTWHHATMSIPAWLYKMYISGKATFISWRQVVCDVRDIAFEM